MKSEILISKSETNLKIKCSNDPNQAYALERDMLCFDHSNFSHWRLPFDVTQGGEPVESFRISNFVLRI